MIFYCKIFDISGNIDLIMAFDAIPFKYDGQTNVFMFQSFYTEDKLTVSHYQIPPPSYSCEDISTLFCLHRISHTDPSLSADGLKHH